jgi:hypothetical protein
MRSTRSVRTPETELDRLGYECYGPQLYGYIGITVSGEVSAQLRPVQTTCQYNAQQEPGDYGVTLNTVFDGSAYTLNMGTTDYSEEAVAKMRVASLSLSRTSPRACYYGGKSGGIGACRTSRFNELKSGCLSPCAQRYLVDTKCAKRLRGVDYAAADGASLYRDR